MEFIGEALESRPPDLSKDAEHLSRQDTPFITPPYISASRCTRCRKIIVDYERHPYIIYDKGR